VHETSLSAPLASARHPGLCRDDGEPVGAGLADVRGRLHGRAPETAGLAPRHHPHLRPAGAGWGSPRPRPPATGPSPRRLRSAPHRPHALRSPSRPRRVQHALQSLHPLPAEHRRRRAHGRRRTAPPLPPSPPPSRRCAPRHLPQPLRDRGRQDHGLPPSRAARGRWHARACEH